MKMLLTLPVVIAALSMTAGCTKKRDAKLADGDGRYSETVSSYQGKTFKVTTHEPLGNGGLISTSETATTASADEKSIVKTFPAVRYTTNAKLVDAVPFLAAPNTANVYEIHYNLTNSHLVVSKVAPANYIPYQEQTYADKLADGRLSVPLFGYPIIGKVSREVAKNDLGEKTSRLVERQVLDINQASHVQIDFTRIEEFGAIKKIDTFPVSYFTGDKEDSQWYFGETILNAPNKFSMSIGDGASLTLFDVRQSLIKFQRSKDGLEIIGLAVDEHAQENKQNFQRTGFIPGEYKQFKVEKEGRFKKMREEEESSDRVHWSKTQYIKLDFARMMGSWINNKHGPLARFENGDLKVVSLSIENDFMSIILENGSSNARYHVSFLKKKKDQYKPLVYHQVDNKLFGYYATLLPYGEASDYRMRREGDQEKKWAINRFDPNVKTIEYYVSKSTPDYAIPGAQAAVDAWDKAFQEANTGIHVVLGKGKKETGDIRYNIINMIDIKGAGSDSGLFGYGPSLTDPFTGKVITSTSTIHLQNFRYSLVGDIRGYVLSKTGALPNYYQNGRNGIFEIFSGAAATMKAAFGIKADADSKTQEPKMKMEEKRFDPRDPKIKGHPSRYADLTKFANIEFAKKYSSMQQESAIPVLIDNVESDLQTYCPEVINYIGQLKASGKKYDENEIPLIEGCANKIIPKALVATLVHEMGHNFGLRHNFAGSSDRANFFEDANGNPTVNTSSIMDYVPLDYRKLDKPGKYDIAAIRYAYAGEVQLNKQQYGEKIVKIDLNKDLRQNMEEQGLNLRALKPYKLCTEFEARAANTDPMCQDFDAGWTPEQLVEFWMKEANQTFALGQYKWDRARSRDHWTQAMAFYQSAGPLMKFYGHWREKLAEYMGKKNLYLEGMSEESYAKVLQNMSKDPVYGPIYKTYKPLTEKIFNFFVNYSFLPDRYCVVQKDDGNMDVIEFNKVRRKVHALTSQSIKGCGEPAGLAYFGSVKQKFVSEFGYASQDIRYDLSDEGQMSSLVDIEVAPFDVLSSDPIRDVAMQMVTLRATITLKGIEMGLVPAMVDEPQFRKIWLDKVAERIVEGVTPAELIKQPDLAASLEKQGLKDKFLKSTLSARFSEEKIALDNMVTYTKMGMNILGSPMSSIERGKPINGFTVQSGGIELIEGLHFSPGSDAPYTTKVLERFSVNKALVELKPDEIKKVVEIVAAMQLPQNEEELKKMTVGDFMKRMEVLNAALKAAGEQEGQVLGQRITMLFPEILNGFMDVQEFAQNAQKDIANDPSVKNAKSEEEQKKAANDVVEKILASESGNLVKKFKPFSLDEKLKQLAAKLEELKRNNDETLAQQDLLLMFMLR